MEFFRLESRTFLSGDSEGTDVRRLFSMAVINGNHNIIKGELTLHLFIYLLFIYLFIYLFILDTLRTLDV